MPCRWTASPAWFWGPPDLSPSPGVARHTATSILFARGLESQMTSSPGPDPGRLLLGQGLPFCRPWFSIDGRWPQHRGALLARNAGWGPPGTSCILTGPLGACAHPSFLPCSPGWGSHVGVVHLVGVSALYIHLGRHPNAC